MEIILTDAAAEDLEEIHAWYLSRSKFAASRFLFAVRAAFDRIQFAPLSQPEEDRNVRGTSLNKYPYRVYYRIIDPHIEILAIFHTSRDPDGWRSRVE
ncbi:MAG: type II toxin-antitoxin system RelE/ParE family toxin [Fimbriiglobus sp.]